ncbi:hypothetical protein SAMN04487969_1293 [Paenibacillus algorifonticola]|uniref:Uncharacterized protein n=1 Tax=Paenibacillus algorifonticola TaxID=684063 RepID=A0A1I2I4I4_9BACL|nr:hypothetical protein SAMN04487969_1293 [Paenibacillus algorifonticola]
MFCEFVSSAGGDGLSKEHIVKVKVSLTDMNDFKAMIACKRLV